MFLSTITERQLSPKLTILEIENAHATATISLLGGQVLSFKPKHDGRERLFISDKAVMDGSKPVRGGIPICWPWFGAHKENPSYPAHGFVRTRVWNLISNEDHDDHTRVVLEAPDTTHPGFDGTAELRVEVLVGRELTVKLITRNTGDRPIRLTMALHTYFSVADVRKCTLEGLQGKYSDKTLNWAIGETPRPYRFTGETDRIHLYAAPEVLIVEPHYTTTLQSSGHDSIVVWNPWSTGVKNFMDMNAYSWMKMLCVESGVTKDGHMLQPEETWAVAQSIM